MKNSCKGAPWSQGLKQSTQTEGASLIVLHDWIVHDNAHWTVRGETHTLI
jgi:hypothetical protein